MKQETQKEMLVNELVLIKGENARCELDNMTEKSLGALLAIERRAMDAKKEQEDSAVAKAFKDRKARIVEVTRSFSRTVQVKDFHPITVFCSLKAEVDIDSSVAAVSKNLYEKCFYLAEKDMKDSLAKLSDKKDELTF